MVDPIAHGIAPHLPSIVGLQQIGRRNILQPDHADVDLAVAGEAWVSTGTATHY